MNFLNTFTQQDTQPIETQGLKIELINARWQINGKKLKEATHIERVVFNDFFTTKRNQKNLD